MKKAMNRILSLVLVLVFVVCLVSCNQADGTDESGTSTETELITVGDTEVPEEGESDTEADTKTEIAPEGLWTNATYRKNMAFGNGAKTITVEVKAADQIVTFTVKTDKDTVGAALIEHNLIAGEDGAYGLYVKTVNGILADYDVDQSYWAFYIDGKYAMTGVDKTAITEGVTYQLVHTK